MVVEFFAMSTVAWLIWLEAAATWEAMSTCCSAPVASLSAETLSWLLADATLAAEAFISADIVPMLVFIACMDLAKTPISSFLLKARSDTGMEKSPFAIKSICSAERMTGMAMLLVMTRDSHIPTRIFIIPRRIKVIRPARAELLASPYRSSILLRLYWRTASAALV